MPRSLRAPVGQLWVPLLEPIEFAYCLQNITLLALIDRLDDAILLLLQVSFVNHDDNSSLQYLYDAASNAPPASINLRLLS